MNSSQNVLKQIFIAFVKIFIERPIENHCIKNRAQHGSTCHRKTAGAFHSVSVIKVFLGESLGQVLPTVAGKQSFIE